VECLQVVDRIVVVVDDLGATLCDGGIVIATQKYNQTGSAWLGALNWEAAGQALQQLPVVIPLGGSAVEHGPHLPYDTDLVVASALVEVVARQFPVLVAPPIDYVYAPEVDGHGATLSVSAESFIGLVSDVISSLARHAARHILIVARGESTLAPLQIVSREMHQEYGITVAIASEAGLAHEIRSAIVTHPAGNHAGEAETSLMLAIAPERVRLDRTETTILAAPAASPGAFHEPLVIVSHRIDASGVAGDLSAASAEKGRRIFDASVAEIVEHLQSITATWKNYPAGDGIPDSAFDAIEPRSTRPAGLGIRLSDLYGPDWPQALDRCQVAVLPMGATSKEHGYHLPNQTDYITADALGDSAVARLPILLLPTFGYGYYPAFVDWPGSMSLSPDIYRRIAGDIIACLANAGLKKILLLDTGLSTRPVLEIVARDALREHGVLVALATTELGREVALDLFDGEGTHANQDETALLLAIAPDQVDLSRAVADLRPSTVISRRDPFAPPAFIQGGKMRSTSGVFGDPTKATRESGVKYLDAKIHDLVTFLEEFIALKL